MILTYYLEPAKKWPRDRRAGGYTLFNNNNHWMFDSFAALEEDVAALKKEFGLASSAPIWGIDTGYDSRIRTDRKRSPDTAADYLFVQNFGAGTTIFRTPPRTR